MQVHTPHINNYKLFKVISCTDLLEKAAENLNNQSTWPWLHSNP